MNGLEASFRALLGHLTQQGVRLAVVGGLAVSARTEPRFTRDVDLCVAVSDDQEAESLVRLLQAEGYRVVAMAEQQATGRLATVRLVAGSPGDEAVVLDLLFASSGIEAEVVDSADVMELFERLAAPIASVASLIALKVLARDDAERPQDRVDLVALLRVASRDEVLEARRLLALIQDRGYARGRDLPRLLDLLSEDLGV